MEKQEVKRTTVQNLAVELGGDVMGYGAGMLIGGVAMGIVENIPGIGKPTKLLMKLGSYGIALTTTFIVRDQTQKYFGSICDSINGIKGLFAGKQGTVEKPVRAEGTVE